MTLLRKNIVMCVWSESLPAPKSKNQVNLLFLSLLLLLLHSVRSRHVGDLVVLGVPLVIVHNVMAVGIITCLL